MHSYIRMTACTEAETHGHANAIHSHSYIRMTACTEAETHAQLHTYDCMYRG